MSAVRLTLPDGSVRELPEGSTARDLAAAIGPGLARAALAAKVNGEVRDLDRPFEGDAAVAILTERDPEALAVLRHSAAHVLATAVRELFPDAAIGFGPAIEDGFYYDFQVPRPFTPEDLERIEARMHDVVAADYPFEREVVPREEANRRFAGDPLKLERIADLGDDEVISVYTDGPFVDLCRGPHIPGTGRLKHFKLLHAAGAYWRGDETRQMLQRIYGTAWFRKEDLETYLTRLEEARKRDHRVIGKQLDLFSIQEVVGPGLVFWHPKGAMIKWLLTRYVEDEIFLCLDQVDRIVHGTFGLELDYEVSTRPPERLGDDEVWDRAEAMLQRALERKGIPFRVDAGGGAFYGPKIDIKFRDAIGRLWQGPTIQLDFNLPERFELEYTGTDNRPHRPVMIHRAIYGTLERFTGNLIEHFAGAFPVWLAPEQVRVIPISDAQAEAAHALAARMKEAGLRVHVDDRNETLNYRIREGEMGKVPYMAVLGQREVESDALALRVRGVGKKQEVMAVEEFLARVAGEVQTRALAP